MLWLCEEGQFDYIFDMANILCYWFNFVSFDVKSNVFCFILSFVNLFFITLNTTI